MIEPGGQLHFLGEVGERLLVHQIRMRNLQRDVDAFERVERAEHRGERTDRELRQQSVLAKFLSSAEHEFRSSRNSDSRSSNVPRRETSE